jgi:hypothetical protein
MSEIVNFLSLIGKPRYLKGKAPSWQFKRQATLACSVGSTPMTITSLLGLVYFSGIFIPKRCGDMWGFGIHKKLSNPLKYSSPKNNLP